MSATSRVLADLKKGLIIGTDNGTCIAYGTNRIPDAIHRLRAKGHVIETIDKTVYLNGRPKIVAQYQMAGA